jgi:hypothetical protein
MEDWDGWSTSSDWKMILNIKPEDKFGFGNPGRDGYMTQMLIWKL